MKIVSKILTLESKGGQLHSQVLLNRKTAMKDITFHLKEELIASDLLCQLARICGVELDSEV